MSPHSKVGAVILAAGASLRFGRPKQFVQFRGKSLVRRAFDAANEAGCCPIVVVTGRDHEDVAAQLPQDSPLVIRNENWSRGIGSSVRAGVEALISQSPVRGILLLVCDQPFVEAEIIRQLIVVRQTSRKPVVACRYSNTLGVPALFDAVCLGELLALGGESGAKSIIMRDPTRVAEVEFDQGAIDIDTPSQYQEIAS
jgi:molybdenum cofactor cytidylyltransferase